MLRIACTDNMAANFSKDLSCSFTEQVRSNNNLYCVKLDLQK